MENKKEVSKFLEDFMEQNNFKLEYIAEMTGASLAAVGHYKKGTRTPKDDFIESFIKNFNLSKGKSDKLRMAVALDRTPDMIRKKYIDKNSKAESNVKNLNKEEFIVMPVMAKASAGNGYLNFNNEPIYNKVIRKNGFHEYCYLIEVTGNSMEPLIQDGSFVVVDPYQVDYIENKIYVIKYEEEIYIKRVIFKHEANLMILKSINPIYDDIYIPISQADSVKIIGRAIKIFYEENL